MKSVSNPAFVRKNSAAKTGFAPDKRAERKEGLILLAIAILFLANVVLYLCHHYGLTAAGGFHPQVGFSERLFLQ